MSNTLSTIKVTGNGSANNTTITPLPSIADLVRMYATTTAIPSKRSNKNKSGRRNLKQYRGQQALRAVGGFTHDMDAIAAPADYRMCVTYEEWAERKEGTS